jgi:hypothetical protein
MAFLPMVIPLYLVSLLSSSVLQKAHPKAVLPKAVLLSKP